MRVLGRSCRASFATAIVVATGALLVAGCSDDTSAESTHSDSTPLGQDGVSELSLSPHQVVRGELVEAVVPGLKAGAEADLTVATLDGTSEVGVGSGKVGKNGSLSTTFTMPNSLGPEVQVEPGEYRLVVAVKGPSGRQLHRDFSVTVAELAKPYRYVPSYECLDFTWFDGRLWELARGDIDSPQAGSTIELVTPRRATYSTPSGGHVTWRVADPASFDPETFECPPQARN